MSARRTWAVLMACGLATSSASILELRKKPRAINPVATELAKAATTHLHVSRSNATTVQKDVAAMPCQCQPSNPSWKACTRSVPKCVFIDLGAADGNSFNVFLNDGYGSIQHCPSSQWEAVLVEANPRFKQPLSQVVARHAGQVIAYAATAAYMCEGQTSFYLDTVTAKNNYWGSSMSSNHPDVVNSGKTKVTVPTVNLNKILVENTIPGDYVLVKMDVEGAEYDILPCLANSPSVSLMDALYMEQHDPSWGLSGTTKGAMEEVKKKLQSRGIYVPAYDSPTLLLLNNGNRTH